MHTHAGSTHTPSVRTHTLWGLAVPTGHHGHSRGSLVQAFDDTCPVRSERRPRPHRRARRAAPRPRSGGVAAGSDAPVQRRGARVGIEAPSSVAIGKPAHGHISGLSPGHRERRGDRRGDGHRRAASRVLDPIGDPSISSSSLAYDAVDVQRPALRRDRRGARAVRELVGVAAEIAELASAPLGRDGGLDEAEQMVFNVAERRATDTMRPFDDLLLASLTASRSSASGARTITGPATGYTDLDKLLAGLQPCRSPSSAPAPRWERPASPWGCWPTSAPRRSRPASLFSLEMGHLELTQRLLASEADRRPAACRPVGSGPRTGPKIGGPSPGSRFAPIFIDDNPNVTVMDIRARARRLKKHRAIWALS